MLYRAKVCLIKKNNEWRNFRIIATAFCIHQLKSIKNFSVTAFHLLR